MKIFFHAPVSDRMRETNLTYYNYIFQLGHHHTTDLFLKLSQENLYNDQVRQKAKELHKYQLNNIKKADIVVFGATEQSLGVGFRLKEAILLSKPVIALSEDLNKIPFLFDGINYDKLIAVKCNLTNYKTAIPNAIEDAAKIIDKRFTVLIPPDVLNLLNKFHQQTGHSRSHIIRDLIRKAEPEFNLPDS